MRKSLLLLMAASLIGLLPGSLLAQEKTLAIVVKGLDNPFFGVM